VQHTTPMCMCAHFAGPGSGAATSRRQRGANVAAGMWTELQAKAMFARAFMPMNGEDAATVIAVNSTIDSFTPTFAWTPEDFVEALIRIAALLQEVRAGEGSTVAAAVVQCLQCPHKRRGRIAPRTVHDRIAWCAAYCGMQLETKRVTTAKQAATTAAEAAEIPPPPVPLAAPISDWLSYLLGTVFLPTMQSASPSTSPVPHTALCGDLLTSVLSRQLLHDVQPALQVRRCTLLRGKRERTEARPHNRLMRVCTHRKSFECGRASAAVGLRTARSTTGSRCPTSSHSRWYAWQCRCFGTLCEYSPGACVPRRQNMGWVGTVVTAAEFMTIVTRCCSGGAVTDAAPQPLPPQTPKFRRASLAAVAVVSMHCGPLAWEWDAALVECMRDSSMPAAVPPPATAKPTKTAGSKQAQPKKPAFHAGTMVSVAVLCVLLMECLVVVLPVQRRHVHVCAPSSVTHAPCY
jgi:hypothetical protein